MDLFEGLGGCVVPIVVGIIFLIILACVAIVIFGAAIPNLLG